MDMDAEKAAKVAKQLLKKLKSGKSLTVAESAQMDEIRKTDITANSIADLALLLNVARQTLYNWKAEKSAPKSLDLRAWQEYAAEKTAHERSGKLSLGGKTFTAKDIADLKGQLLAEKTKKESAERQLKEIEPLVVK